MYCIVSQVSNEVEASVLETKERYIKQRQGKVGGWVQSLIPIVLASHITQCVIFLTDLVHLKLMTVASSI